MKTQKFGFSLPEALITLVIIGVVSAILLPTLIRNFNERVNSNKEANVANKITQAMEHMNADGDLNYYPTTEEFVEALSKHLKITKICDNEHLTDCWSSKVVRMASGSNYEVKNAKTGRELHTGNTTNNVGIVLADGSQMILTYNPNVGASAGDNIVASKKSLPVGFGKTKEFAYTTSVTSGIDYVLDVNGPAGPNAETTDDGEFNDIRSFRIASFSTATCQGFKVNGVCYVDLGTNYNGVACTTSSYDNYCTQNSGLVNDFYAGARKACGEIGMNMTSKNDLLNLVTTHNENIPSEGDYFSSDNAYAFTAPDFALYKASYYVGKTQNKYKVLCIQK